MKRLRRTTLVLSVALLAVGVAAGLGLAHAFGGTTTRTVFAESAAGAKLAAFHTLHRGGQTFLYSQDAEGGTLTGGDAQHLTLTLTGVRDWVTRFSDRPARDAQTVDVRDFLARWAGRFRGAPPNAVLSYRVPESKRARDIVLELRDPRYDAATDAMTYTARRISDEADRLPGTLHPRKPVDYPLPRTFGAAALFIDDSSDEVDQTVEGYPDEVSWTLTWRPDLSQCAGYGNSPTGSYDIELSYESYSDHSCAFKPTYARWDVIDADYGTKYGTITLNGSGGLVSCTDQLECDDRSETNNETVHFGVN